MTKLITAVGFSLLLVISITVHPQTPTRTNPDWAFPVINGSLPPEPAGPKTAPGSKRTYTQAQIDDPFNSPDWFPDAHPLLPPVPSV